MLQRAALILLATVAAGCGAEQAPAPAPVLAPAPATSEPAAATAGLLAASSAGRAPVDPAAPVTELAAGLNDAGFALLRTRPATENAVLSPASIGHALLMARAAADEGTGRAIDAALALPDGLAAHRAWNAIDRQIAAAVAEEAELTVAIADRLWPRADLQPDQAWVDLLAAEHGADTRTLDFAGDPEGSREVVNDWVSERTEGLIPDLLPEGAIRPETVLVLTDALHFRARWQTVFGKYPAVRGVFTRADGTTVETEFMTELELGDRRGRGDGFVGAELPYAGDAFSMLVIVPERGRFDEVRDRLGSELLAAVDRTFTSGPYELRLPRWNDHTQLDLEPWLKGIGAAPGAYPAIAPDAFLDAGVHAADITVDELGTVAAAATALAFAESGAPEPELVVAADRPFLYVIRHRASGLALFAGQVADPTS